MVRVRRAAEGGWKWKRVESGLRRWLPTVMAPLIAIGIGVCLTATYFAGGTKSGLGQLLYLPILAAGAGYGPLAGAAAGVVSGVLCGFLPFDTAAGDGQTTSGGLVRLAAFLVAGVAVGMLARRAEARSQQLERLNAQVVHAFERAIDVMHHYTAEHSATVAELAVAVAAELGLDQATITRVRGAALLHDVGKLAVPAAILDKPGPLSPSEWEIVHGHVEASLAIVAGVEEFQPYLAGIRHHHERYDGAGYPSGLSGHKIPLEARIIAVADAYDAMTSKRSYREPLPHRAALAILHQHAGTQFDPEIVAVFSAGQNRLANTSLNTLHPAGATTAAPPADPTTHLNHRPAAASQPG